MEEDDAPKQLLPTWHFDFISGLGTSLALYKTFILVVGLEEEGGDAEEGDG